MDIPILPDELLCLILSRLSVKDLSKLKSVSKRWLILISEPHFLEEHQCRSKNKPNIVLLQIENTTLHVSVRDFVGNHYHHFSKSLEDHVAVLPSRWGVLCLVGNGIFYLLNPSTGDLRMLPRCECHQSSVLGGAFAYLSSSDEYVVLHFCLYGRSEIVYFSCADGNCKKTVMDVNFGYLFKDWGVFVNGLFYWIVWESREHPGEQKVVSFNLKTLEFGEISLPQKSNIDEFYDDAILPSHFLEDTLIHEWCLVVLRDFLCLVMTATNSRMEIWMLKDQNSQTWLQEYNIDLGVFKIERSLVNSFKPVYYQEGEILIDLKQSLEWYNIDTGSFRRIIPIDGECTMLLCTDTFISLASRDRANGEAAVLAEEAAVDLDQEVELDREDRKALEAGDSRKKRKWNCDDIKRGTQN